MSHKIRLGPIAIFLVVVAVVLSTLAMLTTATSNADKVLAERFASVTALRYALDAEGERFIKDYDEAVAAGNADAAALGAEKTDTGFLKRIDREGYSLEIEVTDADADGNYRVTMWKLSRNWNAEDPMKDIWKGE